MKHRGVKVVNQRKSWDCGVACLAMFLGKPYGDVAAFARDLVASDLLELWRLHRRGLVIADMQWLADGFGVALQPITKQSDYLVGRNGILGVLGGEMDPAGHWVVLMAGAIVDPDGSEVWPVEDYVARTKARTGTLLVEA